MSDQGNRHAESLAYAIKALKPYKRYIRSIYLYGSCARGEQRKGSDVDIFLFLKEGTEPRLMREIRTVVMPEDYTLPEVDVHFSTSDTFSGVRTFRQALEKEAVRLWPRD